MKILLKKSLLLSLGLLAFATSASLADANVSRIAGSDRYETALKVNQKYITKANGNLAVISSGEDFKSALYGSYMANALKVPFYTSDKKYISKAIFDELLKQNVKRISVIGGRNLISDNVERAIKSKGIKFERIDGVNKYDDNDKIINYAGEIDLRIFETFFHGEPRGDIGNGIVVNDNKFPDLLSSIPFVSATARKQATYLGGIEGFEIDTYNEDRPMEGWRFIIGGVNSVHSFIKTEATENYTELGIYPSDEKTYYLGRISGDDRYKTAVEIAKAYKPVLNKDIKTAVIVDGTNYPDALASGIVATFTDGAVLLTEPNRLNQDTKKFIQENNIKNIVIVGGEKSVSKVVEDELRGL